MLKDSIKYLLSFILMINVQVFGLENNEPRITFENSSDYYTVVTERSEDGSNEKVFISKCNQAGECELAKVDHAEVVLDPETNQELGVLYVVSGVAIAVLAVAVAAMAIGFTKAAIVLAPFVKLASMLGINNILVIYGTALAATAAGVWVGFRNLFKSEVDVMEDNFVEAIEKALRKESVQMDKIEDFEFILNGGLQD